MSDQEWIQLIREWCDDLDSGKKTTEDIRKDLYQRMKEFQD